VLEELTKREKEVLGLLVEGLKRQEIANKLFISYHTVHNHLHNAYGKLGVRNKVEAVMYYLKHMEG